MIEMIGVIIGYGLFCALVYIISFAIRKIIAAAKVFVDTEFRLIYPEPREGTETAFQPNW